jgi:hypothetical protein
MHSALVVNNPFAMMTHPQAVIAAVEASERLRSLRSRVCRPLDKVGFGQSDAQDDGADETGAVLACAADDEAAAAADPAGEAGGEPDQGTERAD